MVYPEDYDEISASIDEQIAERNNSLDHVEYRIVRKDGAVRWVDDYGHYTDTEAYGGIYIVFISDITEKRERMETDMAVSLYRGDIAGNTVHASPIRDALKKMKYSQAKEYYIRTMVAPEDQERLDQELTLDVIVKNLQERPQYTVNYLRRKENVRKRRHRQKHVRQPWRSS